MPTKLKRLPYNSFTIILKFENDEMRDDCILSKEFQTLIGQLITKVTSKYGCKIENITN
ncbi:MAG: hypothetical protein ACTSR8_14265 [Promethearchaeota archaeon]